MNKISVFPTKDMAHEDSVRRAMETGYQRSKIQAKNAAQSPAILSRLQQAVIDKANVFNVLMIAVRVCSLGQITNALFEVGGQYRRNM